MIGFLIALLWVTIKLVVIWGVAYVVKIVIGWVPIIPAPVKTILWYIVLAVAIILTILAVIELLSGSPLTGL